MDAPCRAPNRVPGCRRPDALSSLRAHPYANLVAPRGNTLTSVGLKSDRRNSQALGARLRGTSKGGAIDVDPARLVFLGLDAGVPNSPGPSPLGSWSVSVRPPRTNPVS